MQLRLFLLLALAFASFGGMAEPVLAQGSSHAVESAHQAAEEHRLPLRPPELFRFGKFIVTNSMVVTWFVAAAIILLAQLATRKIKEVPSGLQNFWEWMGETPPNF